MDDLNHQLPDEIARLEVQLDQLERIAENNASLLAPDDQNKTYASEIRTQVSMLFDQSLQIRNDKRASWWWRWLTNRALTKFSEDNKVLEVSCKTLSQTQAQIDRLMTANEESRQQIKTLQQQQFHKDIQSLNKESARLTQQLTTLREADQVSVENLNVLNVQYDQLGPLYERVISLVSSPLVDILYTTGLDDTGKLNLLKNRIEADKSSLLQDGMGDGIFANVIYHAVRRGTVEMLAFILTVLPDGDRSRYLATPVVDQGVATTPLWLAVKQVKAAQDAQTAQAAQNKIDCLIKNGAHANQQIFDGNGNETTLLLWAYQCDQQVTVNRLIEAGANCQAEDSDGNTLLHWAAMKGDEAMLMRLLNSENGNLACVDAKNHQGDDSLALLMKSQLSAEKKYELMQVIFTRLNAPTRLSGQYFAEVDQMGNNFLHHAASKGDLRLVTWLLAHPDKNLLNAKNHQGKTPLSMAVEAGQLEVVQFLFRQSIGLDGIKEVFLSALQNANTTEDLIKIFLANNQFSFSDIRTIALDDFQPILRKWTQEDQLMIEASSYNYLTTCASLANVKLLVANGANPRAIDDLGNSILDHAVLQGDLQRVQYLVEECGVDPHPQNKAGITPLMALYQSGKLPEAEGPYRQVVDYLIQKTSSNRVVRLLPAQAPETLTQKDEKGYTLLHYVAKVGDVRAADQLIQQKPYFGVNPLNHQNEAGETAAHLLVKNETLPEEVVTTVLGFLFAKGKANIHLEDKGGNTPLNYAKYFSVITFLIEKLPEPFQEVKLMPIAHQVMASEGMEIVQKKQFIEGIARANKMTFVQASWFYRNVSDIYYRSKKVSSTVGLALGADADALSKNKCINSFNCKNLDEKHYEFRLMVIGQDAFQVACILDSQSPPPFPEELNKESDAYLNLTDGTTLSEHRRNFWVRVIENREDKRLTLQDYATGNTLLHALVWVSDKGNFDTLNKTGVLYVTERDHRNRTALMLTRERFPQELKDQPGYISIPNKDQPVYLSMLQSVERRLMLEKDTEVVKQIIAELDFSQLTELEMLVSPFGQLRAAGVNPANTAFLWQLTDRNNKTMAESALAILDKDPSSLRCQRLLVNLLEASQIEQHGGHSLGPKLWACREEMAGQISYFAEQYNYILSEAAMQLRVLNFGATFSQATNENVISEKYKALCEGSAYLRKATDSGRTNRSAQSLIRGFFAAEPKGAPLSTRQLQENYAHNMVIYLGLFIEASGIDALVTLPSHPSAPCASLLAVAREKQLPSLYVEIVGRFLTQFGLTNPIELVQQAQTEAACKEVTFFQKNVNRLHGVSAESVIPVTTLTTTGLKITAC